MYTIIAYTFNYIICITNTMCSFYSHAEYTIEDRTYES